MKKVNDGLVEVGDVILTTSTWGVSKLIRAATRSDISHAMVCVADRSVIDATGDGVHARNVQRLAFPEECAVHLLRPVVSLDADKIKTLTDFLRSRIGTQYVDLRELAKTMIGGSVKWSEKQFCSRLVAQAFEAAGIKLVTDPNYCSPEALRKSNALKEIENCTLPFTAEEALAWERLEDLPQLMREATNFILDGARQVHPGLQTFDQMNALLLRRPDLDDDFTHLLQASGYLQLWETEQQQNPWQYDVRIMDRMPYAQIEEYCWSVLASADVKPHRFMLNRGGYLVFERQSGLRFFQLMRELYDHLLAQQEKRLRTAALWLESKGLLAPAMQRPLIPHSSEWFAALRAWDPIKADATEHIINLAGSHEVCSVCGDEPASDYRLEEIHRLAGGIDTLRLCSDCVAIRKRGGEKFRAI